MFAVESVLGRSMHMELSRSKHLEVGISVPEDEITICKQYLDSIGYITHCGGRCQISIVLNEINVFIIFERLVVC